MGTTPSSIYSVDERISVWEDNARMCHYCDKKLPRPGTKSGRATHFDHVVPVTKNGSHSLRNLVVCCKRCNTEKADKDYVTFLQDRRTQAKMQVMRLSRLLAQYYHKKEE